MIDDHRDFYCAISANLIINCVLAHGLSSQWESHQTIRSQIALHLRQTSRLKGFTSTLLPGTREGHNYDCNGTIGLPYWVESIFGLVEIHNERGDTDEMGDDHDEGSTGIREAVVDSDLVLQLLKNLTLQDDLDKHTIDSS